MRYSLTGDLELNHCETEAHKEKIRDIRWRVGLNMLRILMISFIKPV